MIQGSVAVTIEQRRDQEAVVCYDTATGTEIWAYSYSADFQEPMGGPGPRATPTIAGDEVFSLGAVGDLVCLDLRTGKKKWAVNILAQNNNIIWAMSGSPLVYENMVIVNPGAQSDAAKGKAVCAFNRANGELIWASGDTKAGYSSPMMGTLAGKLQVLLFDADCVAGYDPKDGKRLWKFDWPGFNGINVAQPLVLSDDRVFVSRSYVKDSATAMLKVAYADGAWSVKPVWDNMKLRCKFTSPVFYQGYIYGLDEGILDCIEASSGKRKWRDGRYGHGQILLSGDLILILSESGKLVLVQATPDAHHELGIIQALEGDKTWNHLALANGVAYPAIIWRWLPISCLWRRSSRGPAGERRGVSPTSHADVRKCVNDSRANDATSRSFPLCVGLKTTYHGIILRSEGIRRNPNADCGLLTTYTDTCCSWRFGSAQTE